MNQSESQLVAEWPQWTRQIEQYLDICPHFILAGNISDTHFIPTNEGGSFFSTIESLYELLGSRGLEGLLVYDVVDGLRSHPPSFLQTIANELGTDFITLTEAGPISQTDLVKMMNGLQQCHGIRTALVIDYASRLITRAGDLTDVESEFFAACQKLLNTSTELRPPRPGPDLLFNHVFWLVGSQNDLPDWFSASSERMKGIIIRPPNRAVRVQAAERLLLDVGGFRELTDKQREDLVERFADLTEGMSLTSIVQVRTIARQASIPVHQVEDAVRSLKVGVSDNPWRQAHIRQRLAEGEAQIGNYLKGQKPAIEKTLDILKRSVLGLSGAQANSSGGRPKGTLFFAGPTGVGKTELAKAISRLIFGDGDAYCRFDMSEFSSEHSEARLIGAPPGYIGYDSGGELVNSVREKPFSVILFDEIEKAHPRILDKFLQVLEDGRLTDGRGRTVYFSESVLVFTSNLGIYTENELGERVEYVNAECSYSELSTRLRSAIEEHFRFNLQRPELLNRFGDNIVVFDFIREDVAQEIFDKMLENIRRRVALELEIDISFSGEAESVARDYCTADLSNGGRGIGNRLETAVVNPLARALFAGPNVPGSKVVVSKLEISSTKVDMVLA